MSRRINLARVAALAAALGTSFLATPDASACGGFFPPPSQTPADVTDERMILSISSTQTTLYSEIKYSGSPASFGWVLPIHGKVDVALSADALFATLDQLTETKILQPSNGCAPVSVCPEDQAAARAAAEDAGGAFGGGDGHVVVTSAATVGPYATVQLHATDSAALEAWLADNNFPVSSDAKPKIDAYVKEGFDFLAMKMIPGSGVETTRPIRVTSQGASFSLPLRMASIGAHETVGITLLVVSDGRYEPQNAPFFHVNDADLTWDFAQKTSNYDAVRAGALAKLGGSGWEIESSIALDQFRVTNELGQSVMDWLPVPATDQGDGGTEASAPTDGGPGTSAQSASDVQAADVAALFAGLASGAARGTRLHGTLSHASMNADLVLRASADQAELSNDRLPALTANVVCESQPVCTGAGGGGAVGGCRASSNGPSSSAMFAGLAAVAGLILVRLTQRARRR